MKITLIEPAPPGFHVYSFIKQVRLGLPLLGTMLRDLGHDVTVYAESLGELDWDRILASDLVGISTITSTAMKAYRYAERARQAGIPVVMGGPHVSFVAAEALEFCDFVVRGEGEEALLELVAALERRTNGVSLRAKGALSESLAGISGLSYREGEAVRHNPARPLRPSLHDLPMPDLSLIEHREQIAPTPMMTSRGCPHDCEFCSVILMFGRRVRTEPPEKVVAAIRVAQPKRIFFYDDNFVMSKRRTKELLTLMIRADMGVPFSAQIRVDSVCKGGRVDHELLRLLREAGCYLVYLGLESANPATLELFNKNQSVDDISGGLDALHEYGIMTHGMFVFGSDTDTLESLEETTDFAIASGLGSAQFLVLTPLPGTRQAAMLETEGRIFTRNWTLYDGHHVVYWPKAMTPWELQQASIEAHRRFYRLSRARTHTKNRLQGWLITHGWERVPDNMAYLRELRLYSSTNRFPEPPPPGTGAGQQLLGAAYGPVEADEAIQPAGARAG